MLKTEVLNGKVILLDEAIKPAPSSALAVGS